MSADKITFTDEEKQQLAEAVRQGACALVRIWETLGRAGDRMGGLDWEPREVSASDILGQCAISIGDVADPAANVHILTDDSVAGLFSNPENWSAA